MNARFRIDLLRPGQVAKTWQEWFVGPQGRQRLIVTGLGCLGVLLLILVAGVLPTYWRLSEDLSAIPRLRNDLTAVEGDQKVLRANLQALSAEAKRQIRWAELLRALAEQIPAPLRLARVDSLRPPPPAGQPPAQQAEAAPERILRIEALTPLRPGSPPLLDIAQFMAGLMRDPSVNRRFQLRSWEIKPAGAPGPGEQELLQINIVMSERPQ